MGSEQPAERNVQQPARDYMVPNVNGSSQYAPDYFAVHVGEAHVAAAEAQGEAGVVHAEEVQHGGVQIVDLDFLVDDVVAVVVGGAVDGAAPDAAAGQPDGEAE